MNKFDDIREQPEYKEFFTKKDYFILDENNNVIKANLEEWGNFINKDKSKRIVKQETVDNKWISTVFMGIDHSWNGEKLEIFETMVFDNNGNGYEIYCDRYSTWKEAKEGHEKAVQWVREGGQGERLDVLPEPPRE